MCRHQATTANWELAARTGVEPEVLTYEVTNPMAESWQGTHGRPEFSASIRSRVLKISLPPSVLSRSLLVERVLNGTERG
jgi:hypothetical protein